MSVKYDDYKKMANRISYWLLKNNKKIKTRKEYKLSGKAKPFKEVKEIILKNQNTNNGWGRKFLEAAVIDNKDTSLFPNHVTYNNKQYSKAKYVYMAKYVTSWWKTHDKAPATVPTEKASSSSSAKKADTNCKNPYTSKPHYSGSGCNKLGQCTPYYCGPHSIHQGLRKFGVTNISEATLAGWAGTTTSGTDHDGLNTAIKKAAKKAGINVDIKWYNFSDLGKTVKARFETLAKMICKKNVFAFTHIGYQCSGECSSGTVFGHYEMLDQIDVKNQKVRALNSLGSRCGGNSYCGHLQWRSYALEAHFISNISQKSICVVTKK